MLSPGLLGIIGIVLSAGVSAIGAIFAIISVGTAMAGAGTERPEILSRAMLAVVLAEALAIYGLLAAFMLVGALPKITTEESAFKALGAGMVIAMSSLAAGLGIAYCGSAMTGALVEKPETFSGNVISVVLAEAIGIYGLLIAFMLIGQI
jgi:F0F1-type ATP synthase membrane subunit c/vacuolar-type H+-ATPase subunit K